MTLEQFIELALEEDVRDGDHSTLAAIDKDAAGKAVLKIKEAGILAGMDVAERIFKYLDPSCTFTAYKKDGEAMQVGEVAFDVLAGIHVILKAERLVLNVMQRMSGIATLTRKYVDQVKDYPAKILDTRKTTPNFRWFEKEAVKIGGGHNHRFGLYDMIMLKDNHIDFSGGIEKAITRTQTYLKDNHLSLKVEVETRNLDEVKRVLAVGGVDRIMLDNFDPATMKQAVALIDHKYETEASGGITLDTIAAYAQTGVDYISVGALTHHYVSLDLSLKAQIL